MRSGIELAVRAGMWAAPHTFTKQAGEGARLVRQNDIGVLIRTTVVYGLLSLSVIPSQIGSEPRTMPYGQLLQFLLTRIVRLFAREVDQCIRCRVMFRPHLLRDYALQQRHD